MTTNHKTYRNLVAVLRGITPDDACLVTEILLKAGIAKIEVTLNSPNAFQSIERIMRNFKGQGLLGAGTVLTVGEVEKLYDMGAGMIVSPDCNLDVIRAIKAKGMVSYPGVMTPTEALSALGAGADALKFFPGEVITPAGLRAIRAVLPKDADCIAVGGTNAQNLDVWKEAGATGFGVGSALYKPGDVPEVVHKKATELVTAYDAIMGG